MKILIVDDSRTMRMIVKRTLRQAGFGDCEIEEASNGAEALQAIKKAPPHLVLCDWNMPEMNGLELLQALRTEGLSPKFGFVTSEGTTEMRDTAMGAGALFLISKPFTPESFQTVLGPVLS